MRTILLPFFAAASLTITAGCGTTQKATDDRQAALETEQLADGNSVSMIVHGMGCPLCANNVDRQLLAVPGVTDVSIDMGTGRVVAKLADDPQPTREQLARAIRDSGFTLVRFEE